MAGEDNSEGPNVWVGVGRYMGHGLTFAFSTLLFLLAGWWLDVRLGTAPLLLILGAFVGGAAGFYNLYYHLVVEPRQPEDEEDR